MADQIIEKLWIFRQQFPLPPDNENPANNRPLPIHPVWYREVMDQLQVFNQTTMNQCAKRLNYSIERFTSTNRWDFIDSVFFSMTVFTTIGKLFYPNIFLILSFSCLLLIDPFPINLFK